MKKVTMFLWNNFTNDARVTREGKTLSINGYNVTVIAKRERDERHIKKREQLNQNFQTIRINKRQFNVGSSVLLNKHLPNACLMLKMILKGYTIKTDIYHSHDLNTLIQGVVCAKLRRNQKPLVFDSHEVNTSRTHYNAAFVKKIEGFLLQFVDEMIVENETRATYHEKLYGMRPMALHNYSELFDIEKVREANLVNLPTSKMVYLYQGGLQEGRGLPLLLNAFKQSNVDAVLLMVGDGKIRAQLEQQVRELKIEDKVLFTGRVPYKELRAYTKKADVGFQILQNTNFNHYSASSNKLYEYMMAHVPVIGTNLPEIKHVIEKEKIGIVIKESDETALTDAIKYMYDHAPQRAAMKEQMKRAKHIYNWTTEEQKLINLYKRIEREHE